MGLAILVLVAGAAHAQDPQPLQPGEPGTGPVQAPAPAPSVDPFAEGLDAPTPPIAVPPPGIAAPDRMAPPPAPIAPAPGEGSGAMPPDFDPFRDPLPGTTAPPGLPPADAPGTTLTPETPMTALEATLNRGIQMLHEKKYKEAEETFSEALSSIEPDDPNAAVAYLFLGIARRFQDRYDDAIAAYTHSIDLNPGDGETYLRRGIAWFYKGEYGVALGDFDAAATWLYMDPRPEFWRGLALAKQNDLLQALPAYTTAIRHQDNYVAAYVNRGLAYLHLKDYEAAIDDFNQAIRHQPNAPTVYLKRGAAEVAQGRWLQALQSYNEAIRLDAELAEAYYNRSLVYQRLGETTKAGADRAKALQLNPHIGGQLWSAG